MDLLNRDLGRYRVLGRLGAGGMGETYRARDLRLRRDVAIKVLPPDRITDPQARRLLQSEALTLSRLNHPGIATIHDFDSADGVDFVVMELIEGISLATRIGEAALPERDAINYANGIAEAIGAAHSAGVLHGDLKPGNVLITRDNRTKVIDFGLARRLDIGGSVETTRSGVIMPAFAGTLPYMSPEQILDGPIDARSDVYALGALMYEMATGLRPFRDPVAPRLMDAILHHAPTAVRILNPSISPEFDVLINRCLAKNPASRPQSIADLVRDLNALAGGKVPSELPRPQTRSEGSSLLLLALPARVIGPEKDQFLSDAVANTLTAELARHGGLDMRSPPTAEDVARVGGDLARIAAVYHTTTCVVTTVTVTARKLTLNLQLVDVASSRVLWARELEGTRRASLLLLREAAAEIRKRLNVAPAAADSASQPSAGFVGEMDLQRAGYYASLFANRGRAADFELAQAAYGTVLKADPRSARALEGLAVLHLARVVAGAPPTEAAREAERHARRALAIDPNAARAWAVLSEIEGYSPVPDFLARLECALRGAALGPADDFTQARLGSALLSASAFLTRDAMHEAARLDPLVVNAHLYEAMISAVLGEAARGLECIDRVLALEPDAPFALYVRTLILVLADREPEAIAAAAQLRPFSEAGRLPPEWVRFAETMARARGTLASGGPEADSLLGYLISAARGELPFPRWQTTTSPVPILLSRYGRHEAAVDLFVARRGVGLREPLDLLALHDDLAPLRKDPRWLALNSDATQHFRVMLKVMEDARSRNQVPEYIDRALADLVSRAPIAGAIRD